MKITIEHENNTYIYEHGYQAYILDLAFYHDIDKKYGINGVKNFVSCVSECYLKDSNDTPLGALTDYMAEHWEEVKEMSRYDILDKFYLE